jgi:hypothetical protein
VPQRVGEQAIREYLAVLRRAYPDKVLDPIILSEAALRSYDDPGACTKWLWGCFCSMSWLLSIILAAGIAFKILTSALSTQCLAGGSFTSGAWQVNPLCFIGLEHGLHFKLHCMLSLAEKREPEPFHVYQTSCVAGCFKPKVA